MIRPLAPGDQPVLLSLLTEAGLPVEDVHGADWLLLSGYFEESRLIAAGGLERCGDSLLLRSVVTAADCRDQGLCSGLLKGLHAEARKSGYDRVWLLTETATEYFQLHHGYEMKPRSAAPEAIRNSMEFSTLCSSAANLMVRNI